MRKNVIGNNEKKGTIIFIKNMVCNRCVSAVKSVFEQSGLHISNIILGEVTLSEDAIPSEYFIEIDRQLIKLGFELIDDRNSRIIEKIKNAVVRLVHYADGQAREKMSELISKELHHDYPSLSKLFSEVEGITIEQYIIHQKVEKIKEYIVYDELTLNEIAYKMGYSSLAYLSAQFKKVTGLPPSHFKNLGIHQRKPLDKVGN